MERFTLVSVRTLNRSARFSYSHTSLLTGIRLIAEQHLALSHSLTAGPSSKTSVGIIDTSLNAAELVRGCADFVHQLCESSLGCAPELKLEGDHENASFVGVASHLVSSHAAHSLSA